MSDIPKPWQRNLGASRESFDTTPNPLRSSILPTGLSSSSLPPSLSPYMQTDANRIPASAPPIPPRPGAAARSDYPTAGGMGGYMGGQYGYGYGMGGMGGMGSMGGMGLGYSPYLQHYSPGVGSNYAVESESSFVRDAQESTRTAFSAIETVVRAVGSVALMLESTYMALSTSFRAILGLADHFTRMKSSLFGVIAGLSFLSKVRGWLHRLLVLLRVRSPLRDAEFNSAWEISAHAQIGDITSVEQLVPDQKFSVWPFISFFTIILAVPYLLWKFTKSFGTQSASTDDMLWSEGKEEHVLLKANHSFLAHDPRELSFQSGDVLIAAPKHKQPYVRGWLLACANSKVGLVPANYMSIVGVRKPELPLEPN